MNRGVSARQGNRAPALSYADHFGLPMEEVFAVTRELYDRAERVETGFFELDMLAESEKQLVRPQDQENIVSALDSVKHDFEELATTGNFHKGASVLRNAYRNYITNPLRAPSIAANQQLQESLHKIEELELPGHYSSIAAAMQQDEHHNTPIRLNPETGQIEGGVRPVNLASYFDIDGLIKEVLGDWHRYKDQFTVGGMWTDAEGLSPDVSRGLTPYLHKYTQTITELSPDKVAAGIISTIMSNPAAMAWLETKYHLDNYDPSTGGIRQIGRQDVNNLFMSTVDESGNRLSMVEARNDAELAVEGILTELRASVRQTNPNVTDEELYASIHRDRSLQFEIDRFVSSHGIKFAHRQVKPDHQIRKNYIYEGMVNRNIEAGHFSVFQYDAVDQTISPTKRLAQISELREQASILRSKLDNKNKVQELGGGGVSSGGGGVVGARITPSEEERYRIELDEIESQIRTNEAILSSLADETYPKLIRDNIASIFSNTGYLAGRNRAYTIHITSIIPEEELIKLASNNNHDEVLTRIDQGIKQLTKDSIGTSEEGTRGFIRGMPSTGISESEAERLSKRLRSNYMSTVERLYNKAIKRGTQQSEYFRNAVSIRPEGNMSEKLLNDFINFVTHENGNFVDINGVSTADKDRRKMLNEATDFQASFMATHDNYNLNIILSFTHDDERKSLIVTESPFLSGATQGVARDLIASSASGKYINHPGVASNLDDIGRGIDMSFLTVTNEDGRSIGTLGNTLDGLKLHMLPINSSTKDKPIIAHIRTPDGQLREFYLAFKNTYDGVEGFLDEGDGRGFRSIGFGPSPHSFLPKLHFRYMGQIY